MRQAYIRPRRLQGVAHVLRLLQGKEPTRPLPLLIAQKLILLEDLAPSILGYVWNSFDEVGFGRGIRFLPFFPIISMVEFANKILDELLFIYIILI